MDLNKNNQNINSLKFHVDSQDYFGTLATIIDLMKQERIMLEKRHQEMIKTLVEELTYLQKEYKIVKR